MTSLSASISDFELSETLGLSDEDKAALIAFLKTLTDPAYQVR